MGFLYKSSYLYLGTECKSLFLSHVCPSIIKTNEDPLPRLEKIWAKKIFSIAFSSMEYKVV